MLIISGSATFKSVHCRFVVAMRRSFAVSYLAYINVKSMGILADIADIRRDGYTKQPSKELQRLQGADKPALTSSQAGEVRP